MSALETIEKLKALVEAEQNGDPVAHRKAVHTVHQLQLQVESPFDNALRVRFQPLQNIMTRIAIESGILQLMAKKEGQDVSAETLSKESGVDVVQVERLMRIICYQGYCDEIGENLYRANGTTMHVCTPGLLGGEKHHTDIIMAIGGKVAELMRKQGGYHPNPPPGLLDPMEYTHGHRFFDYLAVNEEPRKDFNDYMEGRREGYQLQWFDIFPAAERVKSEATESEDQVLVCDVGGGHGHELLKFQERFPEVKGRLVLEDQASTFEGLTLPKGVEMIPHDFFKPQPIEGARFYYMRQIMHDWSDDDCRIILGHIVKAMNSESRLLIDDYVMPPTDAEFRAIHMDVCMMLYLRSEERTQRRWEELLSSAGLEIVKIWSAETGFESVIETKLKTL